jgi:archaellum component FlaC
MECADHCLEAADEAALLRGAPELKQNANHCSLPKADTCDHESAFAHVQLVKEHDQLVKEHVQSVKEHVQLVKEHVQSVKEHVQLGKEHVQLVKEHIQLVKEHVQLVKEHVQLVKEHVQLGKEHVQLVKEHVQLVKEHVQSVKEHVQLVKEGCALYCYVPCHHHMHRVKRVIQHGITGLQNKQVNTTNWPCRMNHKLADVTCNDSNVVPGADSSKLVTPAP